MKGKPPKFMHFISGFISALVLVPYCFTYPYRKIGVFFLLALAFDCLFKLCFKSKEVKKVNKFHTNYVQIKDPKTGKILKNRYVPP